MRSELSLAQALVCGLLLTSLMTACSGDGGGGGPGGFGGPGPNDLDFNVPINAKACNEPLFGKDVQEAFTDAIQWGNASCVKKYIEMGAKASQKIPVGSHWDKKPTYPIHYALQDSPLFHASGGFDNKGFEVLKALVEGGADLNVKNDANETSLQMALRPDVVSKYPNALKYIIQSQKADLEVKDTRGNTALLHMLNIKNKEFTEFLIAHKANVKAKTLSGESTLQMAIEAKFEDVAIMLVQKDVDPMQSNSQGDNALHRAALHSMTALMKALLAKPVDVNKMNGSQETPLLIATQQKGNDLVKDLIAKNADVNLASSEEAPIHAALRTNNDELSRILIPLIKDVNVRDSNRSTPLMLAAQHASAEHVRSLLARKADTNLQDGKGLTALMQALDVGHAEKVADLVPVSDLKIATASGETAIFFAKSTSDIDLLMRAKADINHRSKSGETPVARALRDNNATTSVYFINNGADISWRDGQQTTLLHVAISNDNLAAASALINRGADVNAGNVQSETPIFVAKTPAAVDLLVENKADVNRMSIRQRSALLNAVESFIMGSWNREPSWALVQKLLQVGASPNVRTETLHTPLHMAAIYAVPSSQALTLVGQLIEKGANVNAKESKGNTALHLVASDAAARLLLAANADVTIRNIDGSRAVDVHQATERRLNLELNSTSEKVRAQEDLLAKLEPGSPAYTKAEALLQTLREKQTDLATKVTNVRAILALL